MPYMYKEPFVIDEDILFQETLSLSRSRAGHLSPDRVQPLVPQWFEYKAVFTASVQQRWKLVSWALQQVPGKMNLMGKRKMGSLVHWAWAVVPGVVVAVKTGCHFAGWECSKGSQIKTRGALWDIPPLIPFSNYPQMPSNRLGLCLWYRGLWLPCM